MAQPSKSSLGRWLLIAAEVGLVIAILGLLLLTWLPAIVGPHQVAPGR